MTWEDFNDGLPTGVGADWIKLAASEPARDGSVTLVAKNGHGFGTALHLSRTRAARDRTTSAAPWAVSAGVVARHEHSLADAAGYT